MKDIKHYYETHILLGIRGVNMDVRYKAELAAYTGETIVEKKYAHAVLKELESYSGTFYGDIEMNDLVLIQKG